MAQNFGNLDRDLIGSKLFIKGKKVLNKFRDLSVRNAKVNGDLQVNGSITRNDPCVGTHGINFTLFTNVPPLTTACYAVCTFLPDGTFMFHGSEQLTQSIGGNNGGYSTVLQGMWEKTADHQYHAKFQFVQLPRDAMNPALPAVPFVRWGGDLYFTLNANGVDGSFTAVVLPHPVNDLTLSLPAPAPFTGLQLDASGVTKKMTF